ncbi:hypothetical protein FOMPIDRAFT_1123344, partial [Fomitopsis schrenkii]
NFASLASGASTVDSLTSPTYMPPLHPVVSWLKRRSGQKIPVPHPPSAVLDQGNEGCWPISGPSGRLGIDLPAAIHIFNFSIGHTPRNLTVDVRSAPRTISLWGLHDAPDADKGKKMEPRPAKLSQGGPQRYSSAVTTHLGRFTYDAISPSHIQTFHVDQGPHALRFQRIVLEVEDNWGFEASTCLCELRVHGEL